MHPLEQLALDVADGRTGPAAGEGKAAALAASGALTAGDLLDWFATADWLAHREDLWERALLLGRLLAAAVAGLPGDAPRREVAECRAAWTELVHLCIIHRPDGALFASGVRAAHAALETARALGDDAFTGQVLYRLGTLHLDPFSRAGDLWWEEHRLWLSLAPEPDHAGLPTPHEALTTAERHLREAVTLRTGAGLGYACKALAQAIQQRHFLSRTEAGAQAGAQAGAPLGAEPPAAARTAAEGRPEDGHASGDAAAFVRALCDRALALIPAGDLEARAATEKLRSGR